MQAKENQTALGQQPRENIMGTMEINPLLIKLSVPMMISMLVQALYNVVDKYHHFISWIPFVASVFYCTSPLDIVSDILPLSGRVDEGFLLVVTILHGIQNGVFYFYPKIRRVIRIIKYIVVIIGIIFMVGLFGHLMINSQQMP